MNKFIKILVFFFVFFIASGLFLAVDVTQVQAIACMSDGDCPSGQTCVRSPAQIEAEQRGDCQRTDPSTSDAPTTTDPSGDTTTGSGDYGLSSVPSDIPQGEIADTIVRVVQYVLGFVGIILFVMIIYGGILYMTAAGNEEQAKKAKSVLTYAIIGIIIVAFSFIIAQFAINALTGGEDGDSSDSDDTGVETITPTED